jgi:hypothetical protein
MSVKVELESFDDGPVAERRESAEYLRGFAAGTEKALSGQTAKLARATQDISATLSDMAFGYAEARVQILNRTRPLLTQVAEVIVPQIAQESFALHLVDVLERDFNAASEEPLRIAVHPDIAEHLARNMADRSDTFFIVGDPTLIDGQALLRQSDTHIIIDLPALTQALQTALNGLESRERSQSNG